MSRLLVAGPDGDVEVDVDDGVPAEEEPYQEAAMWAYQFAGALTVAYDFKEGDIVPLLDVLSALAEGTPPSVSWPAVVPSMRPRVADKTAVPDDAWPSPGYLTPEPDPTGHHEAGE